MNNLFERETAGTILLRISKLQEGTEALWGKMTLPQMLAHCQVPLQVAHGEKQLKRKLMGRLFGKIAKRNMITSPFKKNLPTDPDFIIKFHPDFETEKIQLQILVQHFMTTNSKTIANRVHPFFGKMTEEEWGILSYKHLDHHLKQFGS